MAAYHGAGKSVKRQAGHTGPGGRGGDPLARPEFVTKEETTPAVFR